MYKAMAYSKAFYNFMLVLLGGMGVGNVFLVRCQVSFAVKIFFTYWSGFQILRLFRSCSDVGETVVGEQGGRQMAGYDGNECAVTLVG